jgi:glycosidase
MLVLLLVPRVTTKAVGQLPTLGPQVERLEPPNWWIGLLSNPMLLLTGSNLQEASVTTPYRGVRVARTQSSADGRYIFVWLDIALDAAPGRVPLRIATAAGASTIELPLKARPTSQGNFQGLSPDDVIYLIMPDRFADGDPGNDEPAPQLHTYDRQKPKAWHGGDLRGIREHLGYLHDLGVTALWLTPFWKNDWHADDCSYHGYHAVDLYAVDEHVGTLLDAQALAAEAHKLGMKVVFDFVANHVGPGHPWATAPPSATWLHGSPEQHADAVYNFSGLTDPHASPREYRNVIEGWFANKLPDLNTDDPLVGRYLLQNALWWTETLELDAIRLDTFPYSSRRFWSGWHEGLFRDYPRLTTIGEVWDSDVTITSFFAGGTQRFDGVDSRVTTVFDFPLYGALRGVILRSQPAQRIIDVVQRDWLYPRPNALVTFIGNHDTRRFMGEPGASKQKLEAAAALLLTLRGIPEIYYGDEIGMLGGDDPDNRRDFPGGFPGDPRNAFTAQGRTADEQELFSYIRSLLRLRQAHPALRRGKQWHIGWDDTYYAFLRETAEEKLLVIFNNQSALRTVTLELRDTPLAHVRSVMPVFAADQPLLRDGRLEVRLAPTAIAIFRVN